VKNREYRRNRGRSVSDTEAEDLSEERELLAEMDRGVDRKKLAIRNSRHLLPSPQLFTTPQKGQNRAFNKLVFEDNEGNGGRDELPRFAIQQKGKGRVPDKFVIEDYEDNGEPRDASPSPPRFTAQQKGKGRAIDRSVVESDRDEEEGGCPSEEEDDESEAGQRSKRGPMSNEARQEAIKLAEKTTDAFNALAKKYGKSARALMIAGGLAIQPARSKDNMYNKFKQWYSNAYPIAEGGRWSFIITFAFITIINSILQYRSVHIQSKPLPLTTVSSHKFPLETTRVTRSLSSLYSTTANKWGLLVAANRIV
jgi:hypothetical protein